MSATVLSQDSDRTLPARPGPEPGEIVLQVGMGYMASAVLQAVTKLGVADLLSNGPRAVGDLAAATQTKEDALYRGLRALASVGIFLETAPRIFSLTPAAECLRQDKPGSLRDMVIWLANRFHMHTYAEAMHALKTGETVVEKVYGESCFGYFEKDEETAREFNSAMTEFSKFAAPAALEAYDFSWLGSGTLVDIGGGHGMLLSEILGKVPEIRGVVFDLEHVVFGATERFEALGLTERCKTASGDFFEAVPAGDAYVMKHILHDWDDLKATTILKNIHKASSPNARVVLLEFVLSAGNEPHPGKWLDIEMLLLPGGRERTEEEFRALFAGAGFRLTKVIPTKSPFCVLEAVKNTAR